MSVEETLELLFGDDKGLSIPPCICSNVLPFNQKTLEDLQGCTRDLTYPYLRYPIPSLNSLQL
jgi:hypothetical protein